MLCSRGGLLVTLAQYAVISMDRYLSFLILTTATSPKPTCTGAWPTTTVSPVVHGVRSLRDTGSQVQGAQLGPGTAQSP